MFVTLSSVVTLLFMPKNCSKVTPKHELKILSEFWFKTTKWSCLIPFKNHQPPFLGASSTCRQPNFFSTLPIIFLFYLFLFRHDSTWKFRKFYAEQNTHTDCQLTFIKVWKRLGARLWWCYMVVHLLSRAPI